MRTRMGYELDKSEWPVAQFRFLGRLEPADVERYFQDSDTIVSGTSRYACVMDGRAMLVPEVEFVKRQGLWITAHADSMRRVNCGIAFVTTSALVRGLVRAVMHFTAMPVEHASFSDLNEAKLWARSRVLPRSAGSGPTPSHRPSSPARR